MSPPCMTFITTTNTPADMLRIVFLPRPRAVQSGAAGAGNNADNDDCRSSRALESNGTFS